VTTSAGPRAWVAFTTILAWALFLQAVTGGRMLTGDGWARDVHRAAAGLLVVAVLIGGLVALVRLRGGVGGVRFGLMLLTLGVGLVVQYRLGTASADGEDTLWAHVPLGVALVALMVRLGQRARRLDRAAVAA
jgi:hypothetical protein